MSTREKAGDKGRDFVEHETNGSDVCMICTTLQIIFCLGNEPFDA